MACESPNIRDDNDVTSFSIVWLHNFGRKRCYSTVVVLCAEKADRRWLGLHSDWTALSALPNANL